MEFKFEKLMIWQKAMNFGEDIHRLVHTFPKDEVFNLSSQIRRVVDSIALNIAEGSAGQSNSEFKKFMDTPFVLWQKWLPVCTKRKVKRQEYFSEKEFGNQYEYAFNLMNMMVAFKKKIS